jgi:hypothetical protein
VITTFDTVTCLLGKIIWRTFFFLKRNLDFCGFDSNRYVPPLALKFCCAWPRHLSISLGHAEPSFVYDIPEKLKKDLDISEGEEDTAAVGEYWTNLPTDAFMEILLRVPQGNRCRLRLVCWRWRDVIRERMPQPTGTRRAPRGAC